MYPSSGQKSIYDKLNPQNNQNSFQRKNQSNFNQNNNRNDNKKNTKINCKYGDLQLEAHFSDGNSNNSSQKNIQLKNNLSQLESQYNESYNKINNLANKFSGASDEMVKLINIKKTLKEINSYFAIEHAKFLNELYEITQDNNVVNFDYEKYIRNPKDYDDKLKKIIIDNKYDIILGVNKNNSQENIKRIKNYIKEKKIDNNYNGKNQSKSQNNYESGNDYENQNKSSQQFNFGNSIYGDKNKSYQQTTGLNSNIYGNQNNNRKYENPNEIGNSDWYGNNKPNDYRINSIYGNNNYNPNQVESNNFNDNRKITVKFIYQNNEKNTEFNSNESGAILFYKALELKDDPKIYDLKGRVLTYDTLKEMRIKDVFEYEEPTLNIY